VTGPAVTADRLPPTTTRDAAGPHVPTPPRPPRTKSVKTRPRTRRDATGPLPPRSPLRRPVPTGAYTAVPCWWSSARWVQHVERVYRRHYLLLRPHLVATTGGGISLRAVLAVAGAHAAAADFGTGRSSRPLLGVTGGTTGITNTTGLGARTITRARTFLRLAGMATEIQPGRHRTLPERLDSWERGDKARGWTAEYALHPTITHPVDNFTTISAGHTADGTPPLSGSLLSSPLGGHGVSPQHRPRYASHEDGAPRRTPTRGGRKPGRVAPDAAGLALVKRWRAQPDCPAWIRRYTAETWSRPLAAHAAHGWTERDLTQALRDVAAMGVRIYDHPRRPISYLLALLHRSDINERPTVARDAHAAEEFAQAHQRTTDAPQRRAQHEQARHDAIAALSSRGRAEVLAITAAAAQRAQRNREREKERRRRWQEPGR